MTANTTTSTRRVAAGAVASDIYVVCYTDKQGRDSYRTVIAGDADDARQAHLYHHPGDEIRTVHGPVAEDWTSASAPACLLGDRKFAALATRWASVRA